MFEAAKKDTSDRRLAKIAGSDGYRATIRAYRKGPRAPMNAAEAWFWGETLHEAGVLWASGPIALYAAGHYGELVDFLATVAVSQIKSGRVVWFLKDHAARVAFAIVVLSVRGFESISGQFADFCAEYYDPDMLTSAWDSIHGSARSEIRKTLPIDLRLARVYADSDEVPMDVRGREVAHRLLRWIEKTDSAVIEKHPGFIMQYTNLRAYADLLRLAGTPFGNARVHTMAAIFSHRSSEIKANPIGRAR